MRLIPNLFIVGAARSGTTSLWQRLQLHPQVFMPGDLLLKEPAFFSDLKKSRFQQWESYLGLFGEAEERHRWVGEASTAYLTDPDSARRIHEFNPEAKIIIILRNPVDRAYSLYNWMAQEGYEYAATFTEALALENRRSYKSIPNRLEPEYYYNYLYFRSGLYYEQVKRYVDLFGDRVLILKFEDYASDLHREWTRLCHFLDIEPVQGREHGPGNGNDAINESRSVRSSVAQFILRKLTRYYFSNSESLRESDIGGGKRSRLSKDFFDQARRELDALGQERRVSFIERLRIFRLVRKIVDQWNQGLAVPNMASKRGRDVWVRMGQRVEPPAKMKARLYRRLREGYRSDIPELSKIAGMDFSRWLK